MVKVNYGGKSVWTFGTQRIMPGENEIPDDFMRTMLRNKIVQARMQQGILSVPQDFIDQGKKFDQLQETPRRVGRPPKQRIEENFLEDSSKEETHFSSQKDEDKTDQENSFSRGKHSNFESQATDSDEDKDDHLKRSKKH